MSVSILVVIISAISAALVTFLQNGTYVLERDDHSGGAAVFSTYLERDFASADTAPVVGGSPCSGTGTNVLTLGWTEWVATPASPNPGPNGDSWTVSYVVTTDPIVPVSGATRYQLTRRLCNTAGPPENSLILRNLKPVTVGAPGSVVQLSSTITADCPKGAATLTLPSYLDDVDSQNFTYSGCLKGRTR